MKVKVVSSGFQTNLNFRDFVVSALVMMYSVVIDVHTSIHLHIVQLVYVVSSSVFDRAADNSVYQHARASTLA